jgi:hypothetical protein
LNKFLNLLSFSGNILLWRPQMKCQRVAAESFGDLHGDLCIYSISEQFDRRIARQPIDSDLLKSI